MMSVKEDKFLKEIVVRLLRIFHKTRDKLNINSINDIISILCANIDPQKVFKEFAISLREFDDIEFLSYMVQTLDLTLAAHPMYRDVRDVLKGEKGTPDERRELFGTLYATWSYNPVSTITLCLLSRHYRFAFNLIPRFSGLSVNTHTLI